MRPLEELHSPKQPAPKWLKRTASMASAVLGGILLFNSQTADAFWMHVEGERTADTFSMTGGPMGNVWRKPVYKLDVFSQYTGAKGAACTQPYHPLRTGDGFRFWSPEIANINLLPKFQHAIGCAKSPLQEQILVLELMYEQEDELDFLRGSVQFHGLNTSDTVIGYCTNPATVAFTYHDRYQNLVVWDRKPTQVFEKKVHTVSEPDSLVMVLLGAIFLLNRYRRDN